MVAFQVVLTREDLRDCVDHYLSQESFAFDVETMGAHRADPIRNHVVWLALASETRVDVIPMGHRNGDLKDVIYPLLKSGVEREAKGLPVRKCDISVDARKAEKVWDAPPEQLPRSEVFEALSPVFFSDAVKIGHNVKFDINSIAKYLPEPPHGPFFDTMVAEWCLNSSNYGKLSLDACAKRTLNVEVEKGVGKEIEAHSFDEVAKYAAFDADVTFRLAETVSEKLTGEVGEVFDLEMQVLEVLAEMERTGVSVDMELLAELDQEFAREVDAAEAWAWVAAGRQFNLSSVQEKQRLLFAPKKDGGQGLKGVILTPAGEKKKEVGESLSWSDYSTSAQALRVYANQNNELASALITYAKFGKLRTTYTRPYLGGSSLRQRGNKQVTEHVQSQVVNGRIHTRYTQSRVETGRLSSREPNLQNVPARSPEGKKIRDLFIASPGHRIVQADYSQIEPRIIADLSEDPTMLATYRSGGDVYQSVADKLEVDRSTGKTLVLAIAYGIGPTSIAERTGMSKTEAKDLMTFFRKQFPRIDRHKRVVLARTKKKKPVPYSETVLGRRRYLPTMFSSDESLRSYAERQAYNHAIQGSAADVMKLALVRIRRMLPEYGRLLLTVHDEIVTEVPSDRVEETVEIVRAAMEGAGTRWFSVPLVADVKVADRWGECK